VFPGRIIFLFLALLVLSSFKSSLKAANLENPTPAEVGTLIGAGFTTLAIELGKNNIGPFRPYWSAPGSFDASARNTLTWTGSLKTASTLSDITLALMAGQVIWVPALLRAPYFNGLMFMGESLVYTTLVTDVIKILSGRQRPYAYYQTRPSRGVDDNYGFLSGHTSMTFALATTGSLVLGERFPRYQWLIYTLSFFTAGVTGYLRIAGDMHYLSDVLAGAALGSAIGYAVYAFHKPWVQVRPTADGLAMQTTVWF